MPSFTVPIHEFNACHEPGGSPTGGRFCSEQGLSPAFKAWFGDSKVVDDKGNPLRVYHGTPSRGSESNNKYVRSEQADVVYPDFDEFITADRSGITDSGWLGQGAYFTPDPDYAYEFGDRIIPVYLSIQNPFRIYDDASNSEENRFQFLKSLQGLKGLPDKLKLDLTPPTTQTFTNYRGETDTVEYELTDHRDGGFVLLSRRAGGKPGTGVVEAKGASKESTIFAWRYKYQHQGFLLHIITHELGSQGFRQLLEKNGFDGVIEYSTLLGKKPQMNEIVAFHPHQIKSALATRTFNPKSPKFTEARKSSVARPR